MSAVQLFHLLCRFKVSENTNIGKNLTETNQSLLLRFQLSKESKIMIAIYSFGL